jgi:hypothetical protein
MTAPFHEAVPGERDYEAAHARTYHQFMLGVKWTAAALALTATFLTLWFATPAGFLGAAVATILLAAVFLWAMTHGLARSSEPHPPPG